MRNSINLIACKEDRWIEQRVWFLGVSHSETKTFILAQPDYKQRPYIKEANNIPVLYHCLSRCSDIIKPGGITSTCSGFILAQYMP
jgi:hypothetical protein